METLRSQQGSSKAKLIVVICLLWLWPGLALAQVQDRPIAGPEHRKMEVHVGTWQYEGTKTYSVEEFDSDGGVTRSAATVQGDTWTKTGTMIDGKSKTYKIPTTMTDSPDREEVHE